MSALEQTRVRSVTVESIASIRLMVLQNRKAMDYLLGGTCTVIGMIFCTDIIDSPEHITDIFEWFT